MFTAKLETGDYRKGIRETHAMLNIEMHDAIALASRVGRDTAKKNGRFQNRTGQLRAGIKVIKVRRVGKTIWGGYENAVEYANFVEKGTKAHEILPINYSAAGPLTKSERRSFKRNGGSHARHASGSKAGKLVKNPTAGAGRGQFLRFRIGGRIIFARRVDHPGTDPDPFMEPAREQAEEAFRIKFERGVEKIQRKVWR